jgi:hypothetical protein
MDDTVNVIRPDIQEDDVAADDDMPAALGRRSQTYLKVFRHRLDSLLQARWQGAALLESLLEARR